MSITDLSEREREVLDLVREGKSNPEIGKQLWIAEDTVKTHMRRIFRKLGVTSRAGAVNALHQHGMAVLDTKRHLTDLKEAADALSAAVAEVTSAIEHSATTRIENAVDVLRWTAATYPEGSGTRFELSTLADRLERTTELLPAEPLGASGNHLIGLPNTGTLHQSVMNTVVITDDMLDGDFGMLPPYAVDKITEAAER